MAIEEDVAAAVDVDVEAITEISLEMEALIERRPHHHEEPRRRSSYCSIGASILKRINSSFFSKSWNNMSLRL